MCSAMRDGRVLDENLTSLAVSDGNVRNKRLYYLIKSQKVSDVVVKFLRKSHVFLLVHTSRTSTKNKSTLDYCVKALAQFRGKRS